MKGGTAKYWKRMYEEASEDYFKLSEDYSNFLRKMEYFLKIRNLEIRKNLRRYVSMLFWMDFYSYLKSSTTIHHNEHSVYRLVHNRCKYITKFFQK
uniref:Uncharacterized protein n=1 Tax=viral metagenome TaxID=1070528 RepID=A0A6M3JWM5_9ZZZZ